LQKLSSRLERLPTVHQLRGKDEERDRQQHEAAAQPLQELFGGDRKVLAVDHEVDDRARDHRVADR
jgi:hypothetical protein